jgi:hypothetical protein
VSLEIRPVTRGRDLRAFVDLPFRMYADEPRWVPPLRLERYLYLSRRTGSFFEHGTARLFLAERDGQVVGRISAHIDEAYNAHHDARWGWFGFLEVVDDAEVLEALLRAAEGWLRARGMERMVGPADFTANDGCGVLVEGFDRRPFLRQTWNQPYLVGLCEGAGLEKAMDMFFWALDVSERSGMVPILPELAERSRTEHGMRLRKMSRRSLRKDLDVFAEVYNEAWANNWGFVPYGPRDLDHYAQELQLAFDRDWFMVAETPAGEPVGVAITVPDLNQVLARMGGRLLPFGWLTFLRKRQIVDQCRVGFLGVKPEWQHTGVAALMFIEHFDNAARLRIHGGEMGWILETNIAMNRAMKGMNGHVVRRYRMYERRFGDDVVPAWPADAKVYDPSR